MDSKRKPLSKEQQDRIKRFFNSSRLLKEVNPVPPSPTVELDSVFSRTLCEKRKQRNDTLSTLDETENSIMFTSGKPFQKTKNLMPQRQPFQFGTPTKSMDDTWLQVSDESFLEMERKCSLDATVIAAKPESFEETQLFDIDPPSELWNQTLPSFSALDKTTSPDTTEANMHAIRRPSTIVEETSSQMSSMNKADSMASSKNSSIGSDTVGRAGTQSEHSSKNTSGSFKSAVDDFSDSLRVTKRKYKFFEDEEATPKVNIRGDRTPLYSQSPSTLTKRNRIFFANSSNTNTPESTRSHDDDEYRTPCNANRQFNDTLEAIDFMIEEGKRQEISKKSSTVAPTPLFSCKRTRVLNELAAVEMASFSRRGPLIDLMGSPNAERSPVINKK